MRIIKALILISIFTAFQLNVIAETSYKEGSLRTFDEFAFDSNTLESPDNISESSSTSTEATLDEACQQMDAIKQFVLDGKRLVNQLDSAVFLTLPVGLTYNSDSENLEDPDYFIIIDKATIHPGYAEFGAFMSIKNPLDGQIIRFRADNVKFSFKTGLNGELKLQLVNEVSTKIIGGNTLVWLPKSYAEWDCNGFKSLGVNARVDLSKEKYIKVNPKNGKLGGQVSSSFFVTAARIDDIVVSTSFDAFKIVGFDEAYFSFTNVVLDCSDTYNAPNFKLPADYPGDFSGEKVNLWRGLYVQEAKVFLNQKFNDKDSTVSTLYASSLYLDDFGFTGKMGGTNILSLDKGNLGGWNMSLEKFDLEFYTGDFKGLDFAGKVLVKGTSNPLAYDAFFDTDGNYHFGMSIGRDIGFDVFAAKLNIDETSMITVGVYEGKFQPSVYLNGDISFDVGNSSTKLLKLPGIKFQGLEIATMAPYFDVEYVGLTSSDDLGFNNFPITLSDVSVSDASNNRKSFNFTIAVNLVSSSSLGLAAGTTIGVVANVGDGDWSFHRLEVHGLLVDVEKPGAFKLHGEVLFVENDPVYGNGFRGEIEAQFASTLDLKAVAVFGKVDGYRYFFVDSFLLLGKAGIQMGPLNVSGFGGGLFYRMRQASVGDSSSEMGKSLSDINYVPDNSRSLSIKAALSGGIVRPELIKCEITFGIEFTSSFGLAQIYFNGEANVMDVTELVGADRLKEMTSSVVKNEDIKIKIPGQISASVSMLMDFETHTFHSEMELIINVAGVIKGRGSNNRAGWGVVHIDPDKWYLHMGTPSDQIGLNFIGLMEVGGYFMAGHDIPDAMMMNPKVLEILNLDQTAFDGERENNEELLTGNGFAFGVNFAFDTGDLTFLIFYARLEMGGGFDISLLDYGDNVYCEGRSGTPGINGWFAKGQAYTYFAGKIGMKVRVFRKTRKYDIINLALAAAIRIEGPNPTWFKGVVGGSYRILGGLVKGNCKFEVSVGEKCDMRTLRDLSDLEIIADLTPTQDATDVSLYTLPQAVFNMPVDKVIKISDDPGLTKTFKVKLVEFNVYDSNGTVYQGITEWNEDKTSIAYRTNEIFDKDTKYTVKATISFEEFVDNKWQAYKADDGSTYYETKEATFETGPLPTEIDPNSVQYSYPIDRMVNFYKQEYDKAYVIFKPGAAPFFENTPGYTQKARWTQVNGSVIYSDVSYNKQKCMVEADVPSELVNDAVYLFDLVHVPTSESSSIDRNVTESTEQAMNEEDGNTSEITTREAEGVIVESEEKSFYHLAFRVSKYNKFLDKLPTDEITVRFLHNVSEGINLLGVTLANNELFDSYEIHGHGNNPPLIKKVAILDNADWYNENIYPLIYENYPLIPTANIRQRDIGLYGVPPTNPIDMWQIAHTYRLSDEDITNGYASNPIDITHFIYALQQVWTADYIEIRNKLSNEVEHNSALLNNRQIVNILNNYPAPQISKGNYPVKFTYTLPGLNINSSERIINIKNNFDIQQVNLAN